MTEPAWQPRNVLGPYGEVDRQLVTEVVLDLAVFLTNGDEGRQEDNLLAPGDQSDPIHELVTEGRTRGAPRYSSCTDLVHKAAFHLIGGKTHTLSTPQEARARRVVNRQEAWGWRSQVAVSRLRYDSGPSFLVQTRRAPLVAAPAQMLLIGENGAEHVAIIERVDGNRITSLDYGQFWSKAIGRLPALRGGVRRTRTVQMKADGRYYLGRDPDPRPIIGVLDLADWLQRVLDADPTWRSQSPAAHWVPGAPEGWS